MTHTPITMTPAFYHINSKQNPNHGGKASNQQMMANTINDSSFSKFGHLFCDQISGMKGFRMIQVNDAKPLLLNCFVHRVISLMEINK